MGLPFNGDLVPVTSGFANLGVNVSSNANNAFDITTLRPFGQIHMVSGIYHDPVQGQSGVLRFSLQAGAFQVSVDGGKTFNSLSAGGSVTSIGLTNGANLTGNIDLQTATSGFMSIADNAGSGPLSFSVDNLGLSGLWRFPTQGFNGSVVNELTDFNGTKVQGSVSVVGASGVYVDIIGQTMTITGAASLIKSFAATFGSSTSWTVSHLLNTADVTVDVYDGNTPRQAILPDSVIITDVNTVTIGWNVAQAGRVVITGF